MKKKNITTSVEYLACSNIISGGSLILWDNGYNIMDIVETTFRTSHRHPYVVGAFRKMLKNSLSHHWLRQISRL